jgi:N-acetylmuramoyl-L-alanine amidase
VRITENLLDVAEKRLRKDAATRNEIAPTLVVIHYAVTHTFEETARYGQVAVGVAWHLTIDGTQIAQHLPFNRQGAHAGESKWGGLTKLNAHSVGIELANPGPLRRGADGQYRDTTPQQRIWRGEVEEHSAHGFKYWAAYSNETVDTVEAVVATLGLEPVAHSDISPGRKIDPGPAYPMESLRRATSGKAWRK